jgi:hypothetical protein
MDAMMKEECGMMNGEVAHEANQAAADERR